MKCDTGHQNQANIQQYNHTWQWTFPGTHRGEGREGNSPLNDGFNVRYDDVSGQ